MTDVIDVILDLIGVESSESLFDSMSLTLPSLVDRYLDDEDRCRYGDRVQAQAFAALEDPQLPERRAAGWFRLVVSGAYSSPALDHLEDLLAGRRTLPALALGLKHRWDMVSRLMRRRPRIELLEALEAEDGSHQARGRALSIRASIPDAETKQVMWDRFQNDHETSLSLMRSAFLGFQQADQSTLLEPFAFAFLEVLPQVLETRGMEYALAFAEEAFPAYQESPTLPRRLHDLLDSGRLPDALVRVLTERLDDLERFDRIRARLRASKHPERSSHP